MAWARWMVRQASCWDWPNSAFSGGMPADGGGVEQDLGALQGGQAGAFGIPLVPADQRAHAADGGVEGAKAEVAGREVVLFVVERVVGDVHLAIEAAQGCRRRRRRPPCCGRRRRARFSNSEAMRTMRSCLASVGQRLVTRAGDGLGQVEQVRILALAEILGLKKFGQADDVCAAGRGLVDLVDGALQILVGVGRGGHLDQSDVEFLRWQRVSSSKEKIE